MCLLTIDSYMRWWCLTSRAAERQTWDTRVRGLLALSGFVRRARPSNYVLFLLVLQREGCDGQWKHLKPSVSPINGKTWSVVSYEWFLSLRLGSLLGRYSPSFSWSGELLRIYIVHRRKSRTCALLFPTGPWCMLLTILDSTLLNDTVRLWLKFDHFLVGCWQSVWSYTVINESAVGKDQASRYWGPDINAHSGDVHFIRTSLSLSLKATEADRQNIVELTAPNCKLKE